MQDPAVLTYLVGKKIIAVEVHKELVLLHLDDGDFVWVASDWEEDPKTLDPVPRPPVFNFNLRG